jgi:hypothetical protein
MNQSIRRRPDPHPAQSLRRAVVYRFASERELAHSLATSIAIFGDSDFPTWAQSRHCGSSAGHPRSFTR